MNRTLHKYLYKIKRLVFETYWTVSGGQKQTAFCKIYNFHPQTVFLSHRNMRLPKGDCTSAIVSYGDFVQLHSCVRYLQQVKRNPTVVEVGAYDGVYTIILGRLVQQKRGRLIAIEPNPFSYRRLTVNVKRNHLEDTIICEQVAITNCHMDVAMVFNGSQSRISHDTKGYKVRGETLGSVLDKYNIASIDLLIIDIEGAELLALQSIPLDRVSINRIFCELHPYNWKHYGYGTKELEAFLKDRNYRCFDTYFIEHESFSQERYIGPTVFIKNQ